MNQRRTSGKKRSWPWIIVGILILLYPIVATLWNDHLIKGRAASYSENVREIKPPDEISRLRQEAEAYNAWLAAQGHHAMPPEESSPGFDRYMATLHTPQTGEAIGRIKIESIGVDLPVTHTTRPEVLYHAAGHMFGSSLPVGGQGNNAVISAHTGMVNASMFDQLPMVKDGALVQVQVLDQTLYYRVSGRKVVKPNDWQDVTYEPNRDKLTLITCTPYGINSDRLLVVADRVYEDHPQDTKRSFVLSWWMIVDLLVILIVLLLLAWLERRRRRRQAARKQSAAKD